MRIGISLGDGMPDIAEQALRSVAAAMHRVAAGASDTLDLTYGLPATALPEALGSLRSLRRLTVANSGLTSLPQSLGQLRELDHLAVQGNPRLRQLPLSFTELSGLRSLAITVTPLEALPEDIGRLRNLRSVELTAGRYARLPDSLTQLPRLERLNVSHSSHLTELPAGIERLQVLRSLSAEGNSRLASLPDGLARLPALEELRLDGNRALHSLPDDLGQLQQLRTLSLAKCPALRHLPESIGDLRQLRLLDLTGTGLSTLPPFLARLPRDCEIRVPHHLRAPLRQLRNPPATAGQAGPSRAATAPHAAERARPPRAFPGVQRPTHSPQERRLEHAADALRAIDPNMANAFQRWTRGLRDHAVILQEPLTAGDMELIDTVVAEALRSESFRNTFDQFLMVHAPKNHALLDGTTQVGGFQRIAGDARTAYAALLEHRIMHTPQQDEALTLLRQALQDPRLGLSRQRLLHERDPVGQRERMWPPLRAYVTLHDELGAAAQDAAANWTLAHFEEAQEGGIGDGEAQAASEMAQANALTVTEQRARELLQEWDFGRSPAR